MRVLRTPAGEDECDRRIWLSRAVSGIRLPSFRLPSLPQYEPADSTFT